MELTQVVQEALPYGGEAAETLEQAIPALVYQQQEGRSAAKKLHELFMRIPKFGYYAEGESFLSQIAYTDAFWEIGDLEDYSGDSWFRVLLTHPDDPDGYFVSFHRRGTCSLRRVSDPEVCWNEGVILILRHLTKYLGGQIGETEMGAFEACVEKLEGFASAAGKN
jgi:hypothetical protein